MKPVGAGSCHFLTRLLTLAVISKRSLLTHSTVEGAVSRSHASCHVNPFGDLLRTQRSASKAVHEVAAGPWERGSAKGTQFRGPGLGVCEQPTLPQRPAPGHVVSGRGGRGCPVRDPSPHSWRGPDYPTHTSYDRAWSPVLLAPGPHGSGAWHEARTYSSKPVNI